MPWPGRVTRNRRRLRSSSLLVVHLCPGAGCGFFPDVHRPANIRTIALIASVSLGFNLMRAAESPTNPPPSSVQLSIEYRGGNLMVPGRINDSKPLWFKLDSGFSITTIHPDLVESLQLKRAGTLTIIGIAGKEEA